jgi:hypothetical protein
MYLLSIRQSFLKSGMQMKSIASYLLAFMLISSLPAWAQESPLKGIAGLRVFANPSADSEASGLTAPVIQAEVERLLRQNGIKVVSQEEYEEGQGAALTINVLAKYDHDGSGKRQGFFSVILIEVEEFAYLHRSNSSESSQPFFVQTWRTIPFATGPPEHLMKISLEVIQQNIKEFIDEFQKAR